MALSDCNKAYIKTLQDDNTKPSRPHYDSMNKDLIRQVALMKIGGNPQYITNEIL